MVNIADLEYSADANSGMRQTKNFFLHILVHLMTMRRSVYWTNLLGGPKVPLRLYTEKILFLKGGSKNCRLISYFTFFNLKEIYETYTFLKKRSTFASF